MGFTGFIGGSLINMGFIDFNNEVPLGDISGFVVDENGFIYVGLGFYGKVQVYDSHGVFVKNWKVNSIGGAFNIQLSEEQHIIISSTRNDNQTVYTNQGEVISNETIQGVYAMTKTPWDSYTAPDGNNYVVKWWMFPKIIRTEPVEEIIVSQSIIYKVFAGPLPAWLIGAIGLILNFLLRKKELISKMSK